MVISYRVCQTCNHESHYHHNGRKCQVRGCACRLFQPKRVG